MSIRQALTIMTKYRISGLPVTRGTKLLGILTNRDMRFERNLDQPVSAVMTRENLVTVSVAPRWRRPSESCKRGVSKNCWSWMMLLI